MTDVAIRDNVFLRTDPAYPDYSAWTGIVLGNPVADHVPTRVVIANNTIRSGSPRTNGVTNSVILSPVYATLPPEERPVLANNVLGATLNPELLCPFLQASLRNVVEAGEACGGSTSSVAPPSMTRESRPPSRCSRSAGGRAWASPLEYSGRGLQPELAGPTSTSATHRDDSSPRYRLGSSARDSRTPPTRPGPGDERRRDAHRLVPVRRGRAGRSLRADVEHRRRARRRAPGRRPRAARDGGDVRPARGRRQRPAGARLRLPAPRSRCACGSRGRPGSSRRRSSPRPEG